MLWIHVSPLRSGSLSLKVKGMTRKRTSATRSHCFNTRTVQVPGRRGRCSGGLYWVYSASTSTVMSYDAATTRAGSIQTIVAVRLGPRAHFWTASGSLKGPITPPKFRKILSLGSHSVPICQEEWQKESHSWNNNGLCDTTQQNNVCSFDFHILFEHKVGEYVCICILTYF